VLRELPNLEDDVPKRVLSHRLFQDTKAFERQVERRLVHLIQTRSGIEYVSDADALESVGIADRPRSVWIAGALSFAVGGESVSLARFPGGIGLSRDTVRALRIEEIGGARIVLIENLTSWHQWVTARPGADELVVYTGGFPNRTAQLLLRKLGSYVYGAAAANGPAEGAAPGTGGAGKLPVYHWGDMDAGGIHIFEFLRSRFFPGLVPIGMDEASYLRYADAGMEFSRTYGNKLKEMLASGRFARWHGLLELMLAHGKRIEQESMAIPAEAFG
jgi:DNA topoisomerase VI subunit A